MDLYDTHWRKVVALIQEAFHNWDLEEYGTWQTVVLIPKGDRRDFRGIGLVKVLWKTTTGIINQKLT